MKNPKIETWRTDHVANGGIPLVTTQFATVWEARKARAKELGIDVTDVMGRKIT